jgi:site-specific DNA recombinase
LRPRLRPMRNSAEQPRRGRSAYDQPREAWISIPVPPTVEEALFEAVSEQLAQNRQRSRQRRRGARYLLQGLVVCEGCGYAYYGKSVSRAAAKGKPRRYAYYRCTGTDAYRFGGERVCHNRQVRTDLLDEAVWHDVGSLLAEPQRIELEYHRRLTARTSAAPWESAEHLSAVVAKVKRGMARVVDAYEEGLLGKEEFEPRMRRARERLARLQAAVRARAAEEAEARDVRLILERLEEFAQRVRAGLDQADWTMRREIIRALVKRIEIGDDGVRIVYKVNPGPSVDAPERGSLHYCWRRRQPLAGDYLPSRRIRPLGRPVEAEARDR